MASPHYKECDHPELLLSNKALPILLVDPISIQEHNMTILSRSPIETRQMSGTPEIDLLCACARTNIDAKTAAQIKALVLMDINWDQALEKAKQNGVLPLLYYN